MTANQDGLKICRRFCRIYGRPLVGERHGPPVISRMLEAPYLSEGSELCAARCKSFTKALPVTVSRPRARGRRIAALAAREAAQ